MGVLREITLHWTCDRIGCKECGSGQFLPDGWARLQVTKSKGDSPDAPNLQMNVLLCPDCKNWTLGQYSQKAKDLPE